MSVSVWGPGLEGWDASRPILAGELPYEPRPSPPPPPAILPPTERRRAGPVVRLALAAATEAAQRSGLAPASLRSVFGSSNGDGPVIGSILSALASAGDERVVSPTQFHNSVHNAAAGYWSIGTGNQFAATCIGCHDDTWAACLLTAAAEVAANGGPVLLCCYDHPLPPPLDALRPTGPSFAVALVLGAPGATPARVPSLSLQSCPGPAGPPDRACHLAAHLGANPAARSLPLLIALARVLPHTHDLPYLGGHLRLELHL